MTPIRLIASLRESQADAAAPSTPTPGDAHNPKRALTWSWVRPGEPRGNGGTGGGTQILRLAQPSIAPVQGGAWGANPEPAGNFRRVHFNVAFVDLAALIAQTAEFDGFKLIAATLQISAGDDLETPFETWTPSWAEGEKAAASLSATVLLPIEVVSLGLIVDFKVGHDGSIAEGAPSLAVPILIGDIPITLAPAT